MKQREQREPDRRIDSLLHEWTVKDSPPPRFHEQVWQRITRAEAQDAAGLWGQFVRWLNLTFTRPSVALSFVTVLVLTGVLAGLLQARVERTRTLEQLSSSYVQALDPYQMHH